ncbi:hypothetical protein ACQPT2_07605 [Erwinia amylovora]
MKELSEVNSSLEEKIVFIVEDGNVLHDKKKLAEALTLYIKAWGLIPDPKQEWGIANWVSACLFSVYFDLKNFSTAKDWGVISLKTRTSNIDTSPLIDLGMVCYELSQYDESLKYFDEAYSYGKSRAFQERPKKYLDYYLENKK